jgi:hypothetical protein
MYLDRCLRFREHRLRALSLSVQAYEFQARMACPFENVGAAPMLKFLMRFERPQK